MDVFFSTVVRTAPVEQSGEVIRMDWATKRVLQKTPIFPVNPSIQDPNPRGNSRGGRGIAILDDGIITASYHSLHVYDGDLKLLRVITHPLFVGLHEIYLAGSDELWVTSTVIDAALKIDLKSGEVIEEFWPRETPVYQKALGVSPLDIDKTADNRLRYLGRSHIENPSHLHLNAIAEWQGCLFALFNSFGVIVNLSHGKIIVQDDELKGAHNLVIREDGTAVVNSTWQGYVHIYDLNTGRRRSAIDIKHYGWIRQLTRMHRITAPARWLMSRAGMRRFTASTALFNRGLDIAGRYCFIGLSPASIIQIDLENGQLVDQFQYSKNVLNCIHGLRVIGAG